MRIVAKTSASPCLCSESRFSHHPPVGRCCRNASLDVNLYWLQGIFSMNSPESIRFGFVAHKRHITTFLRECKQACFFGEMEPFDLRSFPLIEVAMDGVPHIPAKLLQRIRFRKD
jgi:hypothetical protein